MEKINIELMRDESIKDLYSKRLQQKIKDNEILMEDNTETCWKKVKDNIVKAVEEALGRRKVNKHGTKRHDSQ